MCFSDTFMAAGSREHDFFFLYKMFKATLSAVLNLPIYQAFNI